jgi:hypothetical protein
MVGFVNREMALMFEYLGMEGKKHSLLLFCLWYPKRKCRGALHTQVVFELFNKVKY